MNDDNSMPDRLGPFTLQWSTDCNAIIDGPVGAPTRLCGQPAVQHFLLVSAEGKNILACAEHLPRVAAMFDVEDSHEPTATCVMPNALWDSARRCCFVEGLEFDMAAEQADARQLQQPVAAAVPETDR